MKLLKLKFTILLAFITVMSYAQDTIIKKNQDEIQAKVIEVTDNSIKYKFWDRQDGPVYNINKTDVFMTIYQDGTKEFYGEEQNSPTVKSNPPTTIEETQKPIKINYNNTNTNTAIRSDSNSNMNDTGSTNASTNITNSSDNDESFVYREGGKVNFGFGYDAEGATDGVITIGAFAPYAFSSNSHGSIEFEVGGTVIFYDGLGIGGDSNTSIYAFSLSGGYGYYVLDSLKVSAGLGYYIGFGNTRANSRTTSFTIDDIYYHTGAEYWFTSGFGMNVRYDAIMGASVGILFKSF